MPTPCANDDAFTTSRERSRMWSPSSEGTRPRNLTHAELEEQLASQGRELLRQLYQDHLNRAASTRSASARSPTPRGLPAAASRPVMAGPWKAAQAGECNRSGRYPRKLAAAAGRSYRSDECSLGPSEGSSSMRPSGASWRRGMCSDRGTSSTGDRLRVPRHSGREDARSYQA